MKKIWILALAAGMSFGGFVRADEPKTAAPATPVKPAAVKDDPTTPAVKGATDKQKAAYVARHEGFMKDKEELLKKGPIQFVALGDSITDGWRRPVDKNGRGGKEVWDKAFGEWNAYNTGIGGDRTQHVLWRIDNGELDGINPNPKVAMLMIGTNNVSSNPDAQNVADGVKACVEDIRKHCPNTKVLLLAIFPRDASPDTKFRKEIKQINDIISKLDDGGKTVKYLDIGDKFLEKDGTLPKDIMPDALHPNAKGYQIWADAVKPVIEQMMGGK